ncbi:MAG: efflux RND transporter periplasmic adaptor subunit [Cytophagaceae bacterium]|jgi:cobalt-zinc-cadmium efflux system membrane fusion protein|nr:efflux RND transporter periplasmic adaptor subunit [Cytophagaceae bacterium]
MIRHIFLLSGIAWLCACTSPSNTENAVNQPLSFSDDSIRSLGISFDSVQWKFLTGSIPASGSLHAPPQEAYTLTFPFVARVLSTKALEGLPVSKGQVILTLESAEIIQVQMDYGKALAQSRFLKNEYERQRTMQQDNIASTRMVEEAKALWLSELGMANGLAEKLKMAGIDPADIENGNIIREIQVRSPMQGYITKVSHNLGMVVPGNQMLCQLVNTGNLHAELKVFEQDISKVKTGQSISFTLVNETNVRNAEVILIGREIEEDKTVRIHGHLKEHDHSLLPGSYIHARIVIDKQRCLSVPQQSVVEVDGKSVVFVRRKIGKGRQQLILQPVTKGLSSDGWVEVQGASITPGTEIVNRGAFDVLAMLLNKGEEE